MQKVKRFPGGRKGVETSKEILNIGCTFIFVFLEIPIS